MAGHVPGAVWRAVPLGRAAADEPVRLSLMVRVDQDLLARELALFDAAEPGRRRHYEPGEFAAKFGVAEKRRRLEAFARANGLALERGAESGLGVSVVGGAGAVEKAFGLELRRYRSADGQVFRAHETEPLVPESLLADLGAVVGLSDRRGVMQPHFRLRSGAAPAQPAAAPEAVGAAFTGAGGPGGSVAPADIKSAYALSVGLDGSGQSAALVEFDGYRASDVALYETQFGLPQKAVTFVSVDGQSNLCGSLQDTGCGLVNPASDGGMIEVALDIDMVLALAPSLSNLYVYEAPNTTQGGIDIYQKIANDDTASVVSTSWGLDQFSAGAAVMNAENTIFAQMKLQGQSVFAAAGDSGAYDASGRGTAWSAGLVVDDPASQPLVTGVGGTGLSGSTQAFTEAVWNRGCTSASPDPGCKNLGAGGGGVANDQSGGVFWTIPAYQAGVVGVSSTGFRNVPDVALNADPVSGYCVCVGGSCATQVGGTSAAAPLWAAFMALMNQQRAASGGAPFGFANTELYRLAQSGLYAATFRDITSGNNGFYNAGAGYDNATGWGAFKGDAMICAENLTAPVSSLTAVSPSVSSITWNWAAAACATSYNVYYATQPTQLAASVPVPQFTRSDLSTNTAAAIIVKGVNANYYLGSSTGLPATSASTSTLAVAPLGASFNLYVSSVSLTWNRNTNPAGTTFAAQISTDVFLTLNASSQTLNASATFFALAGNTSFYLRAAAVSFGGAITAFSSVPVAAATPAAAPVSPAATVHLSSIAFSWGAAGNRPGTLYVAEISTDGFASVNFSSQTLNSSATFFNLISFTTYYLRVQAIAQSGAATAVASLTTQTLLGVPAPTNVRFTAVSTNSLSVGWDLVSGNAYLMVLSTNAAFSPAISSATGVLNQNATSYSLAAGLYYFEVKIATNPDASYSDAISTFVGTPVGSSTTVTVSTFATTNITLNPITGPITLSLPAGALGGAANAMTVTIPAAVPGASTGQSGTVTPLGPAVDIKLANPVTRFSQAVTVTMAVPTPAAGTNLANIHFAYADDQGNWWPELASSYNAGTGVLSGVIWHNTIHAAVVIASSPDLSKVKVFPNPVNFAAAARGTIKFSGLSAGPTIRVYNLAGERVISILPGAAAGNLNDGTSGTAEWNGLNESGSRVARGTYIYVITDPAGHKASGKIGVSR